MVCGTPQTRSPGSLALMARSFLACATCMSRGNVTHTYLLRHPEFGMQLVPVDTTEAALRALQAGECDAAVNVDLVAQKIIHDQKLDQLVRSDVEFGGRTMRKGQRVFAFTSSANRDGSTVITAPAPAGLPLRV